MLGRPDGAGGGYSPGQNGYLWWGGGSVLWVRRPDREAAGGVCLQAAPGEAEGRLVTFGGGGVGLFRLSFSFFHAVCGSFRGGGALRGPDRPPDGYLWEGEGVFLAPLSLGPGCPGRGGLP